MPPERAPAKSGQHRLATGALMLARPLVLPKMLGLDNGGPALRWLPRLLAYREIAVGVAAVAASSRTENRSRGCACSARLTGPRRSSCSGVLSIVRSPYTWAGRSSPPTLAASSPDSALRPNWADDERT